MTAKVPDGSTYVDSVWGYVMEKHQGKWVRQHRLRMEKKIGRKLRKDEIVHHKNGDRTDNRLRNLRMMTGTEHKSLHSKKRKHTKETKEKMSRSALQVAKRPGERKRRSLRARGQHKKRNFGAWTWKNRKRTP